MSETFLQLGRSDQLDVLQQAAQSLGRDPAMLEKDVWVLWTLEHLFKLELQPAQIAGLRGEVIPRMAFKGGTSLSKAFKVIKRFSEDVDVALDQTAFETGIDAFASKLSNSKMEAHQQEEMRIVNALLDQVIAPALQTAANDASKLRPAKIITKADDDGSLAIYVQYPALTKHHALLESVKLEIGGRNPTEPTQKCKLSADLAEVILGLEYPTPEVSVLAAERTFWEKVTLIHAECHRNQPNLDTIDRKSRHWSDLADLTRSEIVASALKQRDLLRLVVEHKTRFYKSNRANYAACLEGQTKLIPDAAMLELLERDYRKMRPMFFAEPRDFAMLIDDLRLLEQRINQGDHEPPG